MKSFIRFLSIFLLLFLIICIKCYETPKPTKYALKCLIDVYKRDDFIKCGTHISLKWKLAEEGGHTLRQKCCSIFDLWDCIDVLSAHNCTKQEYMDVKDFKHKLIDAANKNECTAYNYLSHECAQEEVDNIVN